jgi:hypothetical protein
MIIPKLNKSIKNFIKDEKGSISKSNLVKGALFMMMVGATSKKISSSASPCVVGCHTSCVQHNQNSHSSY